MKGQAAIEYLVILALIAAFIVFMLLGGFKETEVDLAFASARMASQNFADEHDFGLTGINSTLVQVDGVNTYCLYPNFVNHAPRTNTFAVFQDHNDPNWLQAKKDISRGIAKTLLSGKSVEQYNEFLSDLNKNPPDQTVCVPGISYQFCVCQKKFKAPAGVSCPLECVTPDIVVVVP